jgi:hypothetical protein
MKKISILLFFIILTGCSSLPTGPVYKDAVKNLPIINTDKSRITVFRHTEYKRLSKGDAHIKIDGTSKKAIVHGGFTNIDILTGKHTISVNAFGTSDCELDFIATSGEKLFFEVKPQKDSMNPLWFMFRALGAVVGSAVESAGEKCGGEFVIQKVETKYAIDKLATLRKEKPEK